MKSCERDRLKLQRVQRNRPQNAERTVGTDSDLDGTVVEKSPIFSKGLQRRQPGEDTKLFHVKTFSYHV